MNFPLLRWHAQEFAGSGVIANDHRASAYRDCVAEGYALTDHRAGSDEDARTRPNIPAEDAPGRAVGEVADATAVFDDGAGIDDAAWTDFGPGLDYGASEQLRSFVDLGEGRNDRFRVPYACEPPPNAFKSRLHDSSCGPVPDAVDEHTVWPRDGLQHSVVA
jgi:hypothetical protein